MLETLKGFGVPVAIGLLMGLLAVWWVDPTTTGGIALLIVIAVALAVVVGALVRLLTRRPG